MVTFEKNYKIDKERKDEIKNGLIQILESAQNPGEQKEQKIQDYFESNSELFSIHNTYKNYFHQDMILSKCPIDNLKTDYVYLSKKSDKWRIVFGEFELPDNNFFKSGSNDYTAQFNHALQQIQQWQIYVEENKKEVIDYFTMLLQPPNMRMNPIEFYFELIYGRSEDKNKTVDRKRNIAATSKN